MNNNIEVLYDDREVSVGKKLSDNDLIGFPYQIIIGSKNLNFPYLEAPIMFILGLPAWVPGISCMT